MDLLNAPFAKNLRVERFENLGADAELVLEQLGLYPGATIEKLHTAPLGDPVTVRMGSQSFAIQKSVCKKVVVEVIV